MRSDLGSSDDQGRSRSHRGALGVESPAATGSYIHRLLPPQFKIRTGRDLLEPEADRVPPRAAATVETPRPTHLERPAGVRRWRSRLPRAPEFTSREGETGKVPLVNLGDINNRHQHRCGAAFSHDGGWDKPPLLRDRFQQLPTRPWIESKGPPSALVDVGRPAPGARRHCASQVLPVGSTSHLGDSIKY